MEEAGRPTKLTPKFIETAERILNSDINAVILTDEELLHEINQELSEEERISATTWKNWKNENTKDSQGQEFRSLIKKALITQKKNLFKSLRDDNNWTRWAWIIERKFDDWNLRKKQELTGKDGEPLQVGWQK